MGASERRDRHRLTSLTSLTSLTGSTLTGVLLIAGCGAAEPTSAPAGTPASPSSGPSSSPSSSTATPVLTPRARPERRPIPRPSPEPRFTWTVAKVSARTLGKSWHRGCPVPPADLRSVSVRFWGFDRKPHTGVLILHRDVVERTRSVFAVLFDRRFPLRGIRPVSEFGASDDASMAADNTSAFNCRRAVAAGPPSWSRHAYGRAIDVNPVENPYLFGRRVLPPAGAKFTGRGRARRGLIRRNDPVHQAFLQAGYRWGGDFSNPDYQHFDR